MRSFFFWMMVLVLGLTNKVAAQVHPDPPVYEFNVCSGDTTWLVLPEDSSVVYVWPEIPELLEYYGDSVRVYAVNSGTQAITIQNFVVRYYLPELYNEADTLIIRILPEIQPTLPELQYNICQTDTLTIYYPPVPYGYMYVEPNAFSVWDTSSGAPYFTLFPTQSTVFQLFLRNQAQCQIGPFDLTVNVASAVDSISITAFDTICLDSEPFTIEFFPSTGQLSGTGLLDNGLFSPLLAGRGNHLITLVAGNPGCQTLRQKFITVLSDEDVTIDPIPNLCQNDAKIDLPAVSPSGGYYEGIPIFDNQIVPESMEPGQYWLTYGIIGDDGCVVKSEEAFFIKSIPPKPTLSFGNNDSLACEGDTLVLISSPSFQGYLWSTNDTTQQIQAYLPLLYTVTITGANGCTNISDIFAPGFNPIPEVSLSSPEYPNGYNTSSYSLEDGSIELEVLAGVEPLSFLWSNGDTSQNPDSLAAGTYWVVASDPGGCAVADTITLSRPDTTILPPPPPVTGLLLPNSFTPNGDGFNDAYVIRGMDPDYLNNELLVFDIRRQLVFSAKNYSNTWKGLDNSGNKLPAGNYFVVFLSDKLSAPITLAVYLKYE